MKTGKDVLSLADKDALENWKAKDSFEAREWNRLNDGWKHSGRMEIEVELIYKDAQVAYLAQLPILMNILYYPAYQRMGKCIDTLDQIKKVELSEAVRIAAKQRDIKIKDGMDFDYAIYQLAFEHISADDRKLLNELYGDVETDHQYLDHEEIIANLYGGKNELTLEAKQKLATLVAEQSYNKFAKEYQLFHYFACIPLLEVARYFLKGKGMEVKGKSMAKNQEADDEDDGTYKDVTKAMETYAMKNDVTIQSMLKDGCLKWLDDGLIESYTPLAASNNKDLLKRWLMAKVEAATLLKKHVDSGELKIRERTDAETTKDKLYSKGLYDSELVAAREVMESVGLEMTEKGEVDEKKAFEKFDSAVITGESIYAFKGDYDFINKFRERVDTYDANLGLVYAADDPEQKNGHLDRELLICNLNNDGKPNFFSLYNMSIKMLSGLFEGKAHFESKKKNGKIFIEFKEHNIEQGFRGRRDDLIDSYAKLLAFESVFKKLSKVYEADLTHHVADRIKVIRLDMDQYNEAIRAATNTSTDESKKSRRGFFIDKDVMQFEDDLIIDIDAIKPDKKAVEEHEEKLKGIFGEF